MTAETRISFRDSLVEEVLEDSARKQEVEKKFEEEAIRRLDGESPDPRVQAKPVSIEEQIQRQQERLRMEAEGPAGRVYQPVTEGQKRAFAEIKGLKPPFHDPVGRTATRLKSWGPLQELFRGDKLRPIGLANDLDGKKVEVTQGPQQPGSRGNGKA